MMAKKEIVAHVLHGHRSWYTLRGVDVAKISNDLRTLTLRHAWSKTDDDQVRRLVRQAFMKYARETALMTGDLVEVYSKEGVLLKRVPAQLTGPRGATATSRASFVASLPRLPRSRIWLAETVRRDLKLAELAGRLPAEAKFWVREATPGRERVVSVELLAWTGAVLATDYAAARMESFLEGALLIGEVAEKHCTSWPNVLSSGVNEALALVKDIGDRRIAEVMETKPTNYYGRVQYRLDLSCSRLIAVAERGIRLEVDPTYVRFMEQARNAAARLGPNVVRSICGEGGLDLSLEEDLTALVQLDTEACGKPVRYDRPQGCWAVSKQTLAKPPSKKKNAAQRAVEIAQALGCRRAS
jgi:hypothetical protein